MKQVSSNFLSGYICNYPMKFSRWDKKTSNVSFSVSHLKIAGICHSSSSPSPSLCPKCIQKEPELEKLSWSTRNRTDWHSEGTRILEDPRAPD